MARPVHDQRTLTTLIVVSYIMANTPPNDAEPAIEDRPDPTALLPDGGAGDGLVTVESDASVDESVERVRTAIENHEALGLMAQVDHAENAASVDIDLPPTTVLLLGNPALGTPLMQAGRTLAIDLPQKLLVMEESDGTVTITYNDPHYLAKRHGITGEDDRLETVSDALSMLADVAAGRE